MVLSSKQILVRDAARLFCNFEMVIQDMESSEANAALTGVIHSSPPFWLQHISFPSHYELDKRNVPCKYRSKIIVSVAATAYDMGSRYVWYTTSQRGSSTFACVKFGCSVLMQADRIAYFMLECIQGKFILDKNVFNFYITNNLFRSGLLGE